LACGKPTTPANIMEAETAEPSLQSMPTAAQNKSGVRKMDYARPRRTFNFTARPSVGFGHDDALPAGLAGQDARPFARGAVGHLVREGNAADGGLEAFDHLFLVGRFAGPVHPGKAAVVFAFEEGFVFVQRV